MTELRRFIGPSFGDNSRHNRFECFPQVSSNGEYPQWLKLRVGETTSTFPLSEVTPIRCDSIA